MSIGQSFDQTVAYYDGWMKKALPGFADLFSVAMRAVPFPAEQPITVLDLGAGTGLFSQNVLAHYPVATFVLYDLAEKLLDVARRRFEGQSGQFRYVNGDYRLIQREAAYDLVVSSLSIHHLEDAEKQRLFERIYGLLRSPGIFLNIDQVKAPTPALQRLYWEQWLAHARRMGATEAEISSSIERRQTYDRDALLDDQLAWLKSAGFVDVDCLYKYLFVSVFQARKG